jgi:nitric oxide reductase subunit B
MGSQWMHWTVWTRVPGDVIFSIGALAMFIFVVRSIIAIFRTPSLPSQEKPYPTEG